MINCILLVLLLLMSMVLLKCTNFPQVIHFLNFVQLIHLQTLLIITLSVLTIILPDLLSPLVPDDYSCKNTFHFVSQFKNVNRSRKFIVSYDVTSLFTNTPLQETIDIAINLIFNHNPNLNITKKELKKLFLFATSQTHFIFNSKFYNQIDGVYSHRFSFGSCPC